MKLNSEAGMSVTGGMAHAGWYETLAQNFGSMALRTEWFLEFFWLGHIVSSVLIAVGMILLVRQWGPESFQPLSVNIAKYVALGILFMLLGLYFSLAYFESPGFVTSCVANTVMLWCSWSACRRQKGLCFAFWALSCGITLLLTIGGQLHHTWVYPPRESDRIISELLVSGRLVAGMMWLTGLMLALRQLTEVNMAGAELNSSRDEENQ
jgi:hypothetical protein